MSSNNNISEKIKEQYKLRDHKSNLYKASDYTHFVEQERLATFNELLIPYFKDISSIKLLEIGAGHGSNTPYFISKGMQPKNIFLNELLPERILHIKSHFPDCQLIEGDALNISSEESFDIIFQSTVFTSILNDTTRVELANKMWKLLKPGGCILWYDFIFNNPSNKHVKKVSVAELNLLFKNAKEIKYKKTTLAPPIGRKIGRLYPLFNLMPFLRTHIVAVITK